MNSSTPVPESGGGQPGGPLPLLVVLLIWALLGWKGATDCHGPPLVALAGLKPGQFCGERAMETVRLISGDGRPHPAGSPANDEVRERLVGQIREAGFEPSIQSSSAHLQRRPSRPEAPLENILFQLEPDQPAENPVLLAVVSHYDSTPMGPGAGDAAAGAAAVLEVARLLKELPGRRHPVLFLLTDGEEAGLLGADRFLDEHPLAAQIGACINLEARGTSGPSLMFQSGSDNIPFVRLMARHLERPFTGSLFDAIYRRLPNDTDFTLFLRKGIGGFNFAFIGDVQNYHTPEDDLEHLDPRSLQHHGDNAWQLARGFVRDWQSGPRAGDAVWFDLLGRIVLWWPVAFSLPACGLGLVLWFGGWWPRARQAGQQGGPLILFGARVIRIIAGILILLAAVTMAGGLEWLLRLDDRLRAPWPDQPVPLFVILLLALTAMGVLSGSRWLRRDHGSENGDPLRWLDAVHLIWLGAAIAIGLWLPAAVYLFLAPVIPALAIRCLARLVGQGQAGWTTVVLPVCAGLVWIGLVPNLLDAIGFRMGVVWPVICGVFVSSLLPALTWMNRRQMSLFLGGSGVVWFAVLLGTVLTSR